MKGSGEKISMLTAYDYTTASLIDKAGIDAILVGDSLGMVMLGYDTTLPVTVENMITYGSSVVRAAKNSFVVIDMPFMSYQASVTDAVRNAGRIIKETGAQAVKLEGGVEFAEHISAITRASIPVCAHIGMTPQSVNAFGGFKVQGKSLEAARKLIADAKAVEEAGAFMVTLECVPSRLAELVTRMLSIPTIGIGAGAGCDGQVLVYQDMLGMYPDFTPKFAQRFGDIGNAMTDAFKAYDAAVKDGSFPAEQHTFKIAQEIIDSLGGEL